MISYSKMLETLQYYKLFKCTTTSAAAKAISFYSSLSLYDDWLLIIASRWISCCFYGFTRKLSNKLRKSLFPVKLLYLMPTLFYSLLTRVREIHTKCWGLRVFWPKMHTQCFTFTISQNNWYFCAQNIEKNVTFSFPI